MDEEPEKPKHCIEGHVVHGWDEWEEDGETMYEDWTYYECTKWEPGCPRMMTERAHVFPRAFTKDED
jgi:hypothetical protein